MKRIAWASLVGVFAVTGCAVPQQANVPVASLTDTHFKNTATVKNDDLDKVATVTTEKGYLVTRGLLGVLWDDVFLRGFINKDTKQTAFQVYQFIGYSANDWSYYSQANFDTPDGLKSVEVTRINRDVDCSYKREIGTCNFKEHMGWDIDEKVLRAVASRYDPRDLTAGGLRYKVIPRGGKEYFGTITAAEVKGLLDRVDEVKASIK
ncbi:hypothetical protein [Magnetospirillum sp. 64-120]|uniref:hypothetical protein n=1 Tax=Magnetospirillum sp. 64-120 TaxID=1895778 RepID=UPI000926C214|nr:hypothetical protein [Magnetospirillum sp. 64-120]OJX68445.1 MAG: hypothetical protein BGO92_18625 [Magnetospirillum sp. 64-120]